MLIRKPYDRRIVETINMRKALSSLLGSAEILIGMAGFVFSIHGGFRLLPGGFLLWTPIVIAMLFSTACGILTLSMGGWRWGLAGVSAVLIAVIYAWTLVYSGA
jgi:hypothetical protein